MQATTSRLNTPSRVVWPGLILQRALDGVELCGRALHVAGRAAAHLDVVAALRLEAELVVERGDAVDLAGGQPQVLADPDDRVAREVAVRVLHVLQQRDQRVPAARRVLADDWDRGLE